MGNTLSLFFFIILILLFSSIFISYYFLFKNKNLDFFLKLLYGFLYSFFIIISIFFLSSIRDEIYYLYHDKSEILNIIDVQNNNKKFELIFESIETNNTKKIIRMRYREKESDNFSINLLLGDTYRIIYKNERLVWIQSRTGFYCIELELRIILINESGEFHFISKNETELWIYEWKSKENSISSGLHFKKYDLSNPSILLTNTNLLHLYPLINEPVKEYKEKYKDEITNKDKIFSDIESMDIETLNGEKFQITFNKI
jgi:hypothetical protein